MKVEEDVPEMGWNVDLDSSHVTTINVDLRSCSPRSPSRDRAGLG